MTRLATLPSVAAVRGSGTSQAVAGFGGDACARRAPGAGDRRGVGRRATGVLEVSELEEDVLEVGRFLLRGASRLGRMYPLLRALDAAAAIRWRSLRSGGRARLARVAASSAAVVAVGVGDAGRREGVGAGRRAALGA